MNSLIQLIKTIALFLVVFALICFGLSPTIKAVNPPPDGGYPGGNTAEGRNALENLTTGMDNTAIGRRALFENRQGNFNTAVGAAALDANVGGEQNTATGMQALSTSIASSGNTANGYQALWKLSQGSENTAMGAHALAFLTRGSDNIAIGVDAGRLLTIGYNNIYIGNRGVLSDESNTIRIGENSPNSRTFIKGIWNRVALNGTAVYINAEGQLGALVSSQRFKDEIKPMGKASEAILALKPVTFCYKKEVDPEHTPQFGLLAEDVEKVDHNLVVRDKEGKPYSVRYDQVNAMLLNEFLKAHRKIEEHGRTIADQQKRIDALRAGLQKVSTQLELNKPEAVMAVNSQ